MSSDISTMGAAPHLEVPQEKLRVGVLPEMEGESASNVMYGTVFDSRDPNPETRTLQSKIKVYKKMQADPTIGGALQGYENILSLVKWSVEPTSKEKTGITDEDFDEKKAKEARDFVASCFDDMTGTSIGDIVAAALDMLAVGHQITVPQFKIRSGYNDVMGLSSKHNDGKIGWKCWRVINQYSVDKWLVPDGGGYCDLTGLSQLRTKGGYDTIPRNRMLLFRTTSKGDNIEGESILYSAVSTWKRLQEVMAIESVSLSRNLEGIPVLSLPPEYLSKNATDDQKRLRDLMLRMVKSVKYNEQVALVIPAAYDEKGNKLISVELMTAGPNVRVDQCRTVITACEQLIAESVLANFLKLGSGGGSYAMSSSLQDMFVLAMKKYLNNISSVINEEAIPTLLRVNGMDSKYSPVLTHKGLDTDSMGVFVDALMKSIAAGAVIPSKGIQRAVLEKMNLPTDEADNNWEKVEALQAKLMEQQEREQDSEQSINTSNKDEIEATGVELSPEKLSKSKELYEFNGQFFEYEGGALNPLEGELNEYEPDPES
jgi:hypothetical protein